MNICHQVEIMIIKKMDVSEDLCALYMVSNLPYPNFSPGLRFSLEKKNKRRRHPF